MSQRDTKQRILDAAQCLFAGQGYQGTSLRAITGEAGVNLAAVNYHFGSKEALIEALIERRMGPLNEERRQRLEGIRAAARAEGRRPGLEEVLRAFIEPALKGCVSVPGGRDFGVLVSRSLAEPDPTVRRIFLRLMSPMGRLTLETLCEALPEVPRDVLYWRLMFTIGAMRQCLLVHDWPEMLPEGVDPVDDPDSLVDLLIPFVAAGLKAP